MGPIRPTNMQPTRNHAAGRGRSGVTPVDRPTTAVADTASKIVSLSVNVVVSSSTTIATPVSAMEKPRTASACRTVAVPMRRPKAWTSLSPRDSA